MVVRKAWPGKVGEVAQEVAVLLRVELGGDVVEQQQRRPPQLVPEVLDLGDLEGEHQGPLLPLADP